MRVLLIGCGAFGRVHAAALARLGVDVDLAFRVDERQLQVSI